MGQCNFPILPTLSIIGKRNSDFMVDTNIQIIDMNDFNILIILCYIIYKNNQENRL